MRPSHGARNQCVHLLCLALRPGTVPVADVDKPMCSSSIRQALAGLQTLQACSFCRLFPLGRLSACKVAPALWHAAQLIISVRLFTLL